MKVQLSSTFLIWLSVFFTTSFFLNRTTFPSSCIPSIRTWSIFLTESISSLSFVVVRCSFSSFTVKINVNLIILWMFTTSFPYSYESVSSTSRSFNTSFYATRITLVVDVLGMIPTSSIPFHLTTSGSSMFLIKHIFFMIKTESFSTSKTKVIPVEQCLKTFCRSLATIPSSYVNNTNAWSSGTSYMTKNIATTQLSMFVFFKTSFRSRFWIRFWTWSSRSFLSSWM